MSPMKNLFIMLFCLVACYASTAWSEAKQNHAEIRRAATEFIQTKTQNIPGKITLKVDDIDRRISLPLCNKLEGFLPAGAQLLGKTSIGIRCAEYNGWSLFLTAHIIITNNILVSNKMLMQGQTISAEDFTVQSGELGQAGLITEESQIQGKILKFSIGAGQQLRQDMFRTPYAITQGQSVQLVTEGMGFKLHTEGVALNNALEGQVVQVKVSSGQVINGYAYGNGNGVVSIKK